MVALYNEIDPFAAGWLRNLIVAGLIAPGLVDEKDIRDIRPDELAGYRQVHLFAGIAGWGAALRLAFGVPGRVGKLRAYGNAIVVPQAAAFIRATRS